MLFQVQWQAVSPFDQPQSTPFTPGSTCSEDRKHDSSNLPRFINMLQRKSISLDASPWVFTSTISSLRCARFLCCSNCLFSALNPNHILQASQRAHHEISELGHSHLSREIQGPSTGIQDTVPSHEGPWLAFNSVPTNNDGN